MKKLLVAVLAVLCVAPAVSANDWGLGLKLGAGQNDPKGLESDFRAVLQEELDKNAGYAGLEAFYEFNLDETNKIGAKLGWDCYGENELKISGGGDNWKYTEDTYSFPLTIYYKKDNGIKNLSWFAGAGVTFLRTNLELKESGYGEEKEHKSKVFPHIVAGGEYRFTKLFALGLEARYNFSAKTEKYGYVFSDRSGFGAALTGRFYF